MPQRTTMRTYPAYQPVAYNWSGFYVGINGGYSSGHLSSPVANWSDRGGLIGGTIGYNWQLSNVVFGLEGDLDWANISGSTGLISNKLNKLGTARARIGYAFNSWLPYATGGMAYGCNTATVTGLGSDSHCHTGWAIGGGLEKGFTSSLSAKFEVLYADLSKKDYTIGGATASGGLKATTYRVGLNYRF
jgi:outer membrane immunogenic protein